jgi:hypothetical protein
MSKKLKALREDMELLKLLDDIDFEIVGDGTVAQKGGYNGWMEALRILPISFPEKCLKDMEGFLRHHLEVLRAMHGYRTKCSMQERTVSNLQTENDGLRRNVEFVIRSEEVAKSDRTLIRVSLFVAGVVIGSGLITLITLFL